MAWRTTDDPRTEFVTLRLTVSEMDDLDALMAATGARSRSEAVRAAVDGAVSANNRKQAKRLKQLRDQGD